MGGLAITLVLGRAIFLRFSCDWPKIFQGLLTKVQNRKTFPTKTL